MKKSYKGFPIYALIIIGVLIAAQLFSSSFSSQRGQRIEAAKLFEYIDSGVIDAVALEDDVAYAHMKASNIPLSAFSNSAYDFSAIISRDTFVETCRQLAARKAGTTADDVTEIDLGFDLSYPAPADHAVAAGNAAVYHHDGRPDGVLDDDAPAGRRRWQDDDLWPQPGARV